MIVLAALVAATTPSSVTAKLEGDQAHFTVHVKLPVKRSSQNDLAIDLPATGVITSAIAKVDGQTHVLALTDAVRAEQDRMELIEAAPTKTQPWRITITPNGIAIAAAHAGVVEMDFEISAPTCFTKDRRYVDLPEDWRHAIDPSLHIALKTDGTCANGFQRAVWWPTTTKTAPDRVRTTGARFDGEHGHFAHFELDVASQLGTVPADLATVFVVDASRSITTTALRSMQRAIESYAQHAPNSQIQIVAYSRKARALFPSWLNAKKALPRIAREMTSLDLANGSNVDAGLTAAAAWLKDQTGTRRVVLFDDEMLPDRVKAIPATKLKAMLPLGTLVHVVGVGQRSQQPMLIRADEAELAELAKLTEGWAAKLLGAEDNELPQVDAEELVRPIALDHVNLLTPGWKARAGLGVQCSDTISVEHLAEGGTCEWWGAAESKVGDIAFDGLVWNHPIHRKVALVDDPQTIARTIDGDLGAANAEVRKAAHAMNESWSFVATWGGSGGYPADEQYGGLLGNETCDCDFGMGYGHGPMTGHASASIVAANDVEAQVKAAVATCHPGRAIITVELTMNEIVGVMVVGGDLNDHDCMTEAVWDLALVRQAPVPHESIKVRI
ncbi:MAG: VWA domain-containing protein [Kofleriaceae bacterium]